MIANTFDTITVYIAEGEKDVDRLRAEGVVATCNPGGAGKWKAEFNEPLLGTNVIIVADNDAVKEKPDDGGFKHAAQVYDSLTAAGCKTVRIVRAKSGKDAYDHFEAGHGVDDFVTLTRADLPAAAQAPKPAAKANETPVVVPPGLVRVLGVCALHGRVEPPLQEGGDHKVCCPVHHDRNPSATVRVGTERPIVFKCHAGCTQEQFIATMVEAGVPLAELMERAAVVADATTWTPVDLGEFINGDIVGQRPSIMRRSDGAFLMYEGRIHSISSEPEAAKSWLALFTCRQVMTDGGTVMYVDFEDGAAGIAERLKSLGVSAEMASALFTYVRPDEAFGPAAKELITSVLAERRPALVVLDGVTEAMSLHNLSIKDNDDSAKFMQTLPRFIARAGPAVLQLDHVTKSKEGRSRWAIGAQHKLAGIDGTSFGLEVRQPFGRGLSGESRLTIMKDRPGFVRPMGEATFKMTSDSTGMVVAVSLDPLVTLARQVTDYDDLMVPIVEFVREHGPSSRNAIKTAVKGQTLRLDFALKALLARGYLTLEEGPRKAHIYHFVRPYDEEAES